VLDGIKRVGYFRVNDIKAYKVKEVDVDENV
jgi:hypothetical protein